MSNIKQAELADFLEKLGIDCHFSTQVHEGIKQQLEKQKYTTGIRDYESYEIIVSPPWNPQFYLSILKKDGFAFSIILNDILKHRKEALAMQGQIGDIDFLPIFFLVVWHAAIKSHLDSEPRSNIDIEIQPTHA